MPLAHGADAGEGNGGHGTEPARSVATTPSPNPSPARGEGLWPHLGEDSLSPRGRGGGVRGCNCAVIALIKLPPSSHRPPAVARDVEEDFFQILPAEAVDEIVRRAAVDDLALAQHQHLMRQALDFAHIVRGRRIAAPCSR